MGTLIILGALAAYAFLVAGNSKKGATTPGLSEDGNTAIDPNSGFAIWTAKGRELVWTTLSKLEALPEVASTGMVRSKLEPLVPGHGTANELIQATLLTGTAEKPIGVWVDHTFTNLLFTTGDAPTLGEGNKMYPYALLTSSYEGWPIGKAIAPGASPYDIGAIEFSGNVSRRNRSRRIQFGDVGGWYWDAGIPLQTMEWTTRLMWDAYNGWTQADILAHKSDPSLIPRALQTLLNATKKLELENYTLTAQRVREYAQALSAWVYNTPYTVDDGGIGTWETGVITGQTGGTDYWPHAQAGIQAAAAAAQQAGVQAWPNIVSQGWNV